MIDTFLLRQLLMFSKVFFNDSKKSKGEKDEIKKNPNLQKKKKIS